MNAPYFTCTNCHEDTRYKSYATDRVELEREDGTELRVTCSHCHESKTIHPNDISAAPNKVIPIVVGVIVAILMLVLFYMGWILISAILIGAPFAVWAAQQKSAANFNGYRIRRG
ncbi:hypothetical protein [Lewinella sp. 4G2]|uniref:hypothetical protein n=1 Tax=Lewinella sp. 4G2 TaxID=1803372 RepID=UPI0007B49B9C|nr:hypothetical protein [Lewinella sp. 4G2]OAV43996.1 hypothetical protein A3850_005580 [Lewinella sp. 4G2]